MAKTSETSAAGGQIHTRTTADSVESQGVVISIDGSDSVVPADGTRGLKVDRSTATGAYGTVSVGVAATLIKALNTSRRGILVKNNHATNLLYIGFDASVTTANGIPLLPGEAWTEDSFTGTIYGIATGASTDARFQEVG